MSTYLKKEYGKLYEQSDKGKLDVFKVENEHGLVQNMFLKREISTKIDGETYYDLATPYGYGGPVILEKNGPESKAKLLNSYYKKFKEYCKDNRIVSEFIRFHPVLKNYKDFQDIYTIEFQKKTIGTNLKDFKKPFKKEFSRSARRNVQRLLRKGLTFEVVTQPNDLDEFMEIYYESMDRIDAIDYYYFPKEYFDEMLEGLKNDLLLVNIRYNGETIATALNLIDDRTIHGHLAGVRNKYSHLSPSYMNVYALTVWGKENGYDLIHIGGGMTSCEKDSLLKFKRRFGKHTEFDYYFGKQIWNKEIYNELCKINGIDENTDFFPAYRSSM